MVETAWKNFKKSAASAYSDGKGEKDDKHESSIIFTLPKDIESLSKALALFKEKHINLTHIESYQSKIDRSNYEYFVSMDDPDSDSISSLLEDLKNVAKHVVYEQGEGLWFPKQINELDKFANRVLSNGKELDEDHPGYSDAVYRSRRREIATIAIDYKHGEPLPRIDYTKEELNIWDTVFTATTKLHPTHACEEFNELFPTFNYKLGHIPQFTEISHYLKSRTGFTYRPVAGLLSARDFLAGLAFRVFHAAQYIRHGKNPMYTPEPDVTREFIGHAPLLAHPGFAQFVQDLGMISLGAPEEWIKRISRIYWFTLEFGMIRQNGQLKAYGASLLTLPRELEHSVSSKPIHHPFEPAKVCETSYPIEEYQPQYFVMESFEDARKKLKQWAMNIPRPQLVRYNAYTESMDKLEDKDDIMTLIREMKIDMDRVEDALLKLHL